jgi:hypothetical protein
VADEILVVLTHGTAVGGFGKFKFEHGAQSY